MWNRIISFFLSIIAFFAGLFGIDSLMEKKCYEYRDLSYGSYGERNLLDLNIPKENDGEIGLVLFIHGGGWIGGDKSIYEAGIEAASEKYGFAAAAINYRYISEDVDMYDVLDDIEAALALIKEKGKENGVDINKVLLTGGSAGGHLSLLYAYSRAESAPIKPVAVISDSGPTDLTDERYYTESILGDAEVISELFSWACGKKYSYADRASVKSELEGVSPLFYVNENTVPTVINHGMKDSVVPYSNAVSLDAKLTESGVTHYFNSYPNSDHDLGSDKSNKRLADTLFLEYCNTYLN